MTKKKKQSLNHRTSSVEKEEGGGRGKRTPKPASFLPFEAASDLPLEEAARAPTSLFIAVIILQTYLFFSRPSSSSSYFFLFFPPCLPPPLRCAR